MRVNELGKEQRKETGRLQRSCNLPVLYERCLVLLFIHFSNVVNQLLGFLPA